MTTSNKRNIKKRNSPKNRAGKAADPLQPWTLNAFLARLPSGLHAIEPISVEPLTPISQWALYVVTNAKGVRTRHLVGRANGEGRVSSPVKAIDVGTRTATTESGRRYRLIGDNGADVDADYVFSTWLRGTGLTVVRDVSMALDRLLSRKKPLTSTYPNSNVEQGVQQ